MEQDFEKNDAVTNSGRRVQWTGLTEKIPMHPDDFNALRAWISAKRFYETALEKSFTEKRDYTRIVGQYTRKSWMG
jgi:hypothetical protein